MLEFEITCIFTVIEEQLLKRIHCAVVAVCSMAVLDVAAVLPL